MASESDLLPRTRCAELFDQVATAARARGVADVELSLDAGSNALTRFANNTIHQNVAERSAHLSVRTLIDGRTARASTNRLDRESIERVVEEAIAITRSAAPDPQLLPLAGPEAISSVARHFDRTAGATPEHRGKEVAQAIGEVESRGLTAAGIYSTGETAHGILNTRGVFAYHCETLAVCSVTAMSEDSSGWAKSSSCDLLRVGPSSLARRSAEKAVASARPVELPVGKYTVILEPAAVLDLVGQMFGDFSGTAVRDGRSFLVDRASAKLFGENITISDDAHHPEQAGAPFDGEGVPRRRLSLVENGVVRDLAYSRQAAHLAGVAPTGHGFPLPNEMGEAPMNVVIAGGQTPLEEMIASTSHGILVTRLWYIREVDPYEKIMTGMTRDGTFLIEGGKVTRGLRNFRFNQGLIDLLSNVDAISTAIRSSGEEAFDMVAPAMRVRDFYFTEVTKF